MTMTAISERSTRKPFDVERVRKDFPALDQTVRGQPLVYLDSAATALKPQSVIDATVAMYARDCANVHRGVHLLSQRATDAYEAARETVRRFVKARESCECIFVRGTTEGINLVAHSFARSRLRPEDEILVTGLEHHSNIVPWQLAAEATGARLVVAPVDDAGDVHLEEVARRLGARTKIVAVAHASNTLGTVLPIEKISEAAHAAGAVVVVDGAQGAPHLRVDVQKMGCDFYAFSGHKAYGPTGIGVLYGRRELLEALPPYATGGGMIRNVTFEKTTFAGLPDRFEAGTPNIAGAVGLGAALEYLEGLDREALAAHEHDLLAYGTALLSKIPGLRIIGTASEKIGVLSFVLTGAHPHDIGTIVDSAGVAIRTGHHCTQPLMKRFGIAATARASLGMYNRRQDLDALASALDKVRELFA